MNQTTKKAFRSSLREAMLNVLEEAARDYARYGESGTDLRDAPEYLVNVALAQSLTRQFGTLMYRLERPATHHAEHLVSEEATLVRDAMGKPSARFDIVLLNRSNGVPRYIVEVKRGVHVQADAKRIFRMATLKGARPRWQHGFLVTLLRRTEASAHQAVAQMKRDLSNLQDDANAQLAVRRIGLKHEMRRLGPARGSKGSESDLAVWGVVFQVSLRQSRIAHDVCDAEAA